MILVYWIISRKQWIAKLNANPDISVLYEKDLKDVFMYVIEKYGKNVEYKPGVFLESTYEVRVAEILDTLGVEWVKVRRGYIWDDIGKQRRYIPDFYLPNKDLFLDPKNDYLIRKDKKKIDSAMKINGISVIVLSNDQIT